MGIREWLIALSTKSLCFRITTQTSKAVITKWRIVVWIQTESQSHHLGAGLLFLSVLAAMYIPLLLPPVLL